LSTHFLRIFFGPVASAQRPELSWHLRFMKYWGGGQGVSGLGWGVIQVRIRVRVIIGRNEGRLFGIGFSCFYVFMEVV
jgi:hypothetical protein